MNRYCLVCMLASLLSTAAYGQTVIVNDDFESYTSEAELHAVWAGIPVTNQAGVEASMNLATFTGGINADFNADNNVDAADYVTWRKNGGTVDEYNAWTAQFGGPPTPSGESTQYVLRPLTPGDPPTVSITGALEYVPELDPGFPDGSIFPSQGLEPIVLRGDIYTAGADGLGRNSIALRSNLPANLWEMGVYNDGNSNDPAPPGTTGAATHGVNYPTDPLDNVAFARFAIRAQLFGNFNPNWLFFAFDPVWDTDADGLVTSFEAFSALDIVDTGAFHTMEVTFEPVEGGASGDVFVTATLDLLADGMNNAQSTAGVDATITIEGMQVTQAGFDSLRIGGPSNLTSSTPNGFDNIYLSGPTVGGGAGAVAAPEPTTAGLVLLAAAGMLSAVRRRRVQ